jgi:hypothetical protein
VDGNYIEYRQLPAGAMHADVRAYCGSGIYLEKPPCSREITVAWEDELDQDSLLRTVLMQCRHHGQ